MNKASVLPSHTHPCVVDDIPNCNESEQQFIERGLRAEAEAQRTGKLYSTKEVLAELGNILEASRKRRES